MSEEKNKKPTSDKKPLKEDRGSKPKGSGYIGEGRAEYDKIRKGMEIPTKKSNNKKESPKDGKD